MFLSLSVHSDTWCSPAWVSGVSGVRARLAPRLPRAAWSSCTCMSSLSGQSPGSPSPASPSGCSPPQHPVYQAARISRVGTSNACAMAFGLSRGEAKTDEGAEPVYGRCGSVRLDVTSRLLGRLGRLLSLLSILLSQHRRDCTARPTAARGHRRQFQTHANPYHRAPRNPAATGSARHAHGDRMRDRLERRGGHPLASPTVLQWPSVSDRRAARRPVRTPPCAQNAVPACECRRREGPYRAGRCAP